LAVQSRDRGHNRPPESDPCRARGPCAGAAVAVAPLLSAAAAPLPSAAAAPLPTKSLLTRGQAALRRCSRAATPGRSGCACAYPCASAGAPQWGCGGSAVRKLRVRAVALAAAQRCYQEARSETILFCG